MQSEVETEEKSENENENEKEKKRKRTEERERENRREARNGRGERPRRVHVQQSGVWGKRINYGMRGRTETGRTGTESELAKWQESGEAPYGMVWYGMVLS